MNKLIVANWKMNPAILKEAIKLAKASDKKGVVVAPSFVFTEEIGKTLRNAELGAQDISREDPPAGGGPYTGEVSWHQLKKLGVKYVIIGHSERRALGETDATINKKLKIALAHGLKAILCVGEKWSVRKRGIVAAKKFVAGQLRKDLKLVVTNYKLLTTNLFVAYEPVWAIGTGRNDLPEDASEMAEFIKRQTARSKRQVKVLYGGSVNSKNVKSFLEARDIDGLLVGGASLKAGEFRKIIKLI
ncbi:triose-phosphate isomerase [bacterium]|nr:MAG: triose-phosphate isomerase [bacterium]